MGSVGSTAVRTFIDQPQPLLSLHGHVHESQAAQRLGRTLCLNPGSDYADGTLLGGADHVSHPGGCCHTSFVAVEG